MDEIRNESLVFLGAMMWAACLRTRGWRRTGALALLKQLIMPVRPTAKSQVKSTHRPSRGAGRAAAENGLSALSPPGREISRL